MIAAKSPCDISWCCAWKGGFCRVHFHVYNLVTAEEKTVS